MDNKVKTTKDPIDPMDRELSKTRQILWRFSKVEKHVEKKRTTFSELFFDLAVVFIFALLAARLMGSFGVAVVQVESHAKAILGLPTEVVETSDHWVGFFFWMINFMALWFTWYQFSNYTKYHWIDNVGNNLLTLMLIFTLILQGAGIYFVDENLSNYSLLVSFVAARLIFVGAQFIAIHNSPETDISAELMIKTKREATITLGTIILFIAYIICTLLGTLDITTTKDGAFVIYDPWKRELFLTVVLMAHFIIRFTWKIFGSKGISENSYNIVFHTKERHHLFIIIALGELLVVTLTSSFINNQSPTANWETMSYMFSTPFIAIAIWYIYKTVFYKATPTGSKKNYYLYLITHVFLVLGILVFLGSIKSHMQADAFGKTDPFAKIGTSVQDISRTYYSLGVVIGFSMIILSMAIYAKFAVFRQHRWGQVVKGLSPLLFIKGLLVFVWFIVESVLFWLNIKVHFTTVIFVTLGIEVLFASLLIWKSQKVILTLFDTVHHFDEYSAKLDH